VISFSFWKESAKLDKEEGLTGLYFFGRRRKNQSDYYGILVEKSGIRSQEKFCPRGEENSVSAPPQILAESAES